MSDQKPPNWFEHAGAQTEAEKKQEAERKAALLKELPALLKRRQDQPKNKKFEPYLLIRSVLGDRGDRPINVPFWESPDIWTAPGDPATAPDIPPTHGGVVTAGQPNTVYAHVWNLGFAPLLGVVVEFSWFNPSFAFDSSHQHLIGIARVDLGGRGAPDSHKLVKCPKPWVPVMENGGHECLVARVTGLGDPIGNNPWAPWLNRHVGQRNISVVAAQMPLIKIIDSLNLTRFAQSRIELVQLGQAQADLALKLVAPKLRAARGTETHLLGEIGIDGQVSLPKVATATPAMMAPIHALAHGLTATIPRVVPQAAIVPMQHLAPAAPPRPAPPASPAAASIGALFGQFQALHPGVAVLPKPAAGEGHVIRVAAYQGQQLVGGYTLVVT